MARTPVPEILQKLRTSSFRATEEQLLEFTVAVYLENTDKSKMLNTLMKEWTAEVKKKKPKEFKEVKALYIKFGEKSSNKDKGKQNEGRTKKIK
jgi:hypothetical protein